MPQPRNLVPDIAFLAAAALLAWLATTGSMAISSAGAQMDSDLETYAQAMAGASHRELFLADPTLSAANPANSIPNLERIAGGMLAPENEWPTGLLRAGGIAIFIFYAGWYLLGRWLYRFPALAALLAVCCGITIWVGWGTFWGILHSDPIPRVFFAAAMPFLLLFFFNSMNRLRLRPLAMLATGLAIWIHGVSALNCGAMFFTAFMLARPAGTGFRQHMANLFVCLCAFLLPVLFFLWPSLFQGKNFSPDEMEIFKQLFELRWQADYSGFGSRLAAFFSPGSAALPIMAGGLAGWVVIRFKGKGHEKLLARACPAFAAGLLLVAAFCWLESQVAPAMGRLPMGHELVRGLRFLVPISWMLSIGGIALITGKVWRRIILCATLAGVAILSADRQYAAAQYSLSRITGARLPLTGTAEQTAARASSTREIFEKLANIVPLGEGVYCPADAMPARYISLRPLVHSFKDGYIHFYNKDPAKSARWLELEKLARSKPDGWLDAWIASGAPWLLLPPGFTSQRLDAWAEIRMRKDGWILASKKPGAPLQRTGPNHGATIDSAPLRNQ